MENAIDSKALEGSAPSQWALLNRTLLIYKVSAAGLVLLSFVLTLMAFYHSSADPVVVLERCDEKVVYEGRRGALKVTEDDVKQFITRWVTLRYTWPEFAPDKILRAIEPISTEGFQAKLREALGKKEIRGAKDQKVEESAVNVRVMLTEKEALAAFDRIVRIKGIPLVVPSEVSLSIVEGTRNRWNPLGLYVNGVLEHEEK